MAILVKGILSFPKLFVPEIAKGGTEPRYTVTVLIPPNDPQIPAINQQVEQEKIRVYPNGFTGQDVCFQPYDQKFQGKEYYDPRCTGWYALTCSAPQKSKPVVVDANNIEIIDPSVIYSGCVAEVHTSIVGYTKGRGGIGSFMNGVKFSGEEGQFGRLDGRPTIDQMFGGPAQQAPMQQAPMQQAPMQQAPMQQAPMQQAPMQQAPMQQAPAPAGRQMTAKAGGETYEQMVARGWTDVTLIEHGYMLPPGGAPIAF